MRIALISDTHLRHLKYAIDVPPADMVIHAGDACCGGDEDEVEAFFEWFKALPHRHKIFVPGNHDRLFEDDPELARSKIPPCVTFLQDSGTEIDGLKIYGSPWQPEFCEWAFNLKRGWPLRKKWEAVPSGIDILVTHGPPLGILDFSSFGNEHVGCADLRQELARIRPKLHVFGHIHGAYGVTEWAGTLFVNASLCDEAYVANHPAVLVEILPAEPIKILRAPGLPPPRKEAKPIRNTSKPLWT